MGERTLPLRRWTPEMMSMADAARVTASDHEIAGKLMAMLGPLDLASRTQIIDDLDRMGRGATPAHPIAKELAAMISPHVWRSAMGRGELDEWLQAPPHLEKPHGSAAARCLHAFQNGHVICPAIREAMPPGMMTSTDYPSLAPILIEHDLATAFDKAEDFLDGDYRLPFETTWFEARITGKRVVCIVSDPNPNPVDEKDALPQLIPCIEMIAGWVMPMIYYLRSGHWTEARGRTTTKDFQPVIDLIGKQIRAICIALEAKAIVCETVRVSEKLNRARERRGEHPLSSYNIVRLDRRERPAPLPGDHAAATHRSPRLHFRRGHWRHYETHRTWINWQLENCRMFHVKQ